MSGAVTDEDDWLPLPPEAQCAHPGELAALGKRAEAAAAPAPAVPPASGRPEAALAASPSPHPSAQGEAAAAPAAPPPPPEAPEVLQALAALRAKLHAAPAPQSFVAAMQERERRAERRRHRSRRAAAACPAGESGSLASDGGVVPAPVSEGAPQPDTPPGLAASATAAEPDHDPREDSAWFGALPEVEQQRLHKAWADKRANAARTAANLTRNGNERLLAGILVFLAVLLLGTGVNWHATMGAGVVCGIWWRHALADRFLDPMRAGLCMLVLQGLAMVVNGTPSPQLFFDAPLLVSFAALVGFDGEMRRTGGFDVK